MKNAGALGQELHTSMAAAKSSSSEPKYWYFGASGSTVLNIYKYNMNIIHIIICIYILYYYVYIYIYQLYSYSFQSTGNKRWDSQNQIHGWLSHQLLKSTSWMTWRMKLNTFWNFVTKAFNTIQQYPSIGLRARSTFLNQGGDRLMVTSNPHELACIGSLWKKRAA